MRACGCRPAPCWSCRRVLPRPARQGEKQSGSFEAGALAPRSDDANVLSTGMLNTEVTMFVHAILIGAQSLRCADWLRIDPRWLQLRTTSRALARGRASAC